MNTVQKYSQPEVVACWQNLSRRGLQYSEEWMVRHYLPPGGPVLDAGCGAGRAVLALAEAGFRVVGVDLSLPMLAAARSLSAARLGGANLLNLPFADASFEAVVMFFGPLQHIPGRENRRRALAELARVTRPGGRLVIGLDNLAPGPACYLYWAGRKLRRAGRRSERPVTPADTALWSREQRRVSPLVWHLRGVVRLLGQRVVPALVDLPRRWGAAAGEPGDTRVAQFSVPATAGRIFYHLYRVEELAADAAPAGWRLLAYRSGAEITEGTVYPVWVRRADKQLFFAFGLGR